MTNELVESVNKELALELPYKISDEELRTALAKHINYLINSDFEKLVSLLYRIDVNEKKLKQWLNTAVGENSAILIADLIIERQEQKIKSRQQSGRGNNISEEEKW